MENIWIGGKKMGYYDVIIQRADLKKTVISTQDVASVRQEASSKGWTVIDTRYIQGTMPSNIQRDYASPTIRDIETTAPSVSQTHFDITYRTPTGSVETTSTLYPDEYKAFISRMGATVISSTRQPFSSPWYSRQSQATAPTTQVGAVYPTATAPATTTTETGPKWYTIKFKDEAGAIYKMNTQNPSGTRQYITEKGWTVVSTETRGTGTPTEPLGITELVTPAPKKAKEVSTVIETFIPEEKEEKEKKEEVKEAVVPEQEIHPVLKLLNMKAQEEPTGFYQVRYKGADGKIYYQNTLDKEDTEKNIWMHGGNVIETSFIEREPGTTFDTTPRIEGHWEVKYRADDGQVRIWSTKDWASVVDKIGKEYVISKEYIEENMPKTAIRIAEGEEIPKAYVTEEGTPIFTKTESALMKVAPKIGEKIYETRTGINLDVTSLTGKLSDEELKIAERMQFAPKNKTSAEKRAWAVARLIEDGQLPLNYEGVQIKVEEAPETAYMRDYDWRPSKGWMYSSAISTIQSEIDKATANAEALEANIKTAEENLEKFRTNLDVVKASPDDSRWKAPDVAQETLDALGIKKQEDYSKSEMLKMIYHGLQVNRDAISQQSDATKLARSIVSLEKTKKQLEEYQKKGYDIEQTDEGYQFKYPTAYEAHVGIFGQEKTDIMLSSSAFMKTPLAIGTFASAIQYAVTGEEKVQEAERESLAQYSFGLFEAEKKGIGAYIGKVVTSGAVIEGIVIPTLTLGASYTMSAIGAGASGVVPTGGKITESLMGIGQKISQIKEPVTTIGKVAEKTAKVVSKLAGPALITTGAGIVTYSGLEVATEHPEQFGAWLGETGFTIGMMIGAGKAGQKMFEEKITQPVTVDVTDATTGKTKTVTIDRIPKELEVRGEMDILQQKVPGSTENKVLIKGEGIQQIKGRPDVQVTITGEGLQVPGEELSLSQGTGTMTWTEKIRGVEHTFIKEFQWSGTGKYIQELGPTKIYEVAGKAQQIVYTGMGPGETIQPVYNPTISTGTTRISDVGKFKFSTEPVPATFEQVFAERLGVSSIAEMRATPIMPEEILPAKEIYTYSGKFFEAGGEAWGKTFQSGRIFTFEPEKPLITLIEAPPDAGILIKAPVEPIVHTPWSVHFPKTTATIAPTPIPAVPTVPGLSAVSPITQVITAPIAVAPISEVASTMALTTLPALPATALIGAETYGGLGALLSIPETVTMKPVVGAVEPKVTTMVAEKKIVPVLGSLISITPEVTVEPTVVPPEVTTKPPKAVVKPEVTTKPPKVAVPPEVITEPAKEISYMPELISEEFIPELIAEPSEEVGFVPEFISGPVAPGVVTQPARETVVRPGITTRPVVEFGVPAPPEEITAPGLGMAYAVEAGAVPEFARVIGLGRMGMAEEAGAMFAPQMPITIETLFQKQVGGEIMVPPPLLIGIQSLFEQEKEQPVIPTTMVRVTQAQAEEQRKAVKTAQALETVQELETALVTEVAPVTITPTVPFTFTPFIPWTPPPTPPTKVEKPKVKRKPTRVRVQSVEEMRKDFLADIASVTKSQAVYGRATHPALTKEQWEKAESTGFVVVPTVEIQEAEAKEEKPKNVADALGLGEGDILEGLGLDKKRKKKMDLGIGGL